MSVPFYNENVVDFGYIFTKKKRAVARDPEWLLAAALIVSGALDKAPVGGRHPWTLSPNAIRYFPLRTKRNCVRFANSVTAFH